MPRPQTKSELMTAANEKFAQLWRLIDTMQAPQEETFSFEDRDKNVRDILVHLYEWHTLFLQWVAHNRNGDPQPFLPAPYNWRTYPQMNVMFWEKHQNTPYETAKEWICDSHRQVVEVMDTFSNEQLFTKKLFPWTGTSHLGSYGISVTSAHYDWATKKIKKHINMQKECLHG